MTVRVTYVLGLGRSGSTVIGRALAEVLQAVPGDEMMAVWQRGVLEDRVCSCGERFSTCAFWQAVVATSPASFERETADRVVAEIHRVMGVLGPLRALTPRRRAALVASVPDRWFDAVGALYRGMALVGGAETIVDTSKAPVLAWLLARAPGVTVRTVLVVRDPRDVARSWRRPPALPDGAHELPVLAPWKTAVVWLLCNVAGERVQQAIQPVDRRASGMPPGHRGRREHREIGGPGGGLRRRGIVRLEDFTADPSGELRRLCDDLGETGPVPDVLTLPVAKHTMSGHPTVRFASGPLAVRPHDRPAGSNTADRLVALIDAPLLRRYGYALRAAS
jgi:hypothetical protein